jgi:hypothetical protein
MELNKTFIAGKMNKDLDERLVPDGEFIDALNVTIDTSSGSNIGSVTNSLGNTLVTNIQELIEDIGLVYEGSNAKTIGAVTYEADNLIYWLVASDNFDAIFEYSELFQFTSIVLLCSKSIPTSSSILNFNKNFPVTGINYIPASRGEGPFIYWTDGLNPPRRINVARSKGYIIDDPKISEDINVILRPPLYAPKIDLSFVSTDISNNIQDKFIYFSYRFKYKDNQYSSLSPFSSVAFQASGFAYDYNTGDNKGMLNKYNKVDVTFDTGNEFVEEIQVLYFDTYKLNVYIVDNYNKSELGISNNSRYQIPPFSANKIYTPLESSEVTRLFDNVPLSAKAQEIIGNRLVYGNYVQFRDINTVPNYSLTLRSESITTEPKKTFRSDRDYEIGIVYLDEYGRMTTALTSKTNTLYIPSSNSDTANSIQVTLNNEPPSWATNYRFVIKQAQNDYYNIFPRTFVVDGVFRYFLINEADRDKITVGGYVIFKTSNGVATHSNKQFKVLELEYKQASSPFTIEGLYFKVKADLVDVFLDEPVLQVINIQSTGRGPRPSGCGGSDETRNPVVYRSSGVQFEKCYYSANGDNTLIYPYQNGAPNINASSSATMYKDERLSIVIMPIAGNPNASATHFKYTFNPDTNLGLSPEIPIPNTSPFSYSISTFQGTITLTFDQGNYIQGDIYVFNVRANLITYGTDGILRTVTNPSAPGPVSSSGGIPTRDTDGNGDMTGLDPDDYGGHSILNYNGPIYPGALIEINILKDSPFSSSIQRNQNNSWTSDNYYKNLEEWFWKSEAYQSFKYKNQSDALVTSAGNISFRRATSAGVQYTGGIFSSNYIVEDSNTNTGTLCMLVRGVGPNGTGLDVCDRNIITAQLKITQTPTAQLSAETVPLESDIDIFYEMRKTYRIENGNHKVSWRWNDYTYGGAWPNVPTEYDNFTVLGPAVPFGDVANDMKHSFNAGERVFVRNDDPSPTPTYGPPSDYYEILYVINEYAIIIDLPTLIVSGAATGSVFYQSWESDQLIGASSLSVELNNVTSDNSDFNAFAFGNGVESYRIYDNFLRPTMKYSPRATSVIEDYEQEDKIASLCYSGIYKGSTSTNRLNSFNLSQANFKNLDKQYGPIQKLYAQDTNLMVLQQDKITSVLYGKNLLVDAVGGGQVASVPEVLGNQIVHPSEYGISNNPESFAKFANIVFFTDSRRGAVLQMAGDQVVEISANGMRNYFRDELKDNPNTQKLGAYDPYNDTYVLNFTDIEQGVCGLSISRNFVFISYPGGTNLLLFSIESNSSWTITLEDDGYGTDWVDLSVSSGYGNQNIRASVDLYGGFFIDRTISFVITYCDNATKTFTLYQQPFQVYV